MSDMAIDAALGEVLQPNEEQLAQEIASTVAANVQRGPRPALRDAHPRAHGCVQASFRVDDGLPPHLAQGVFVPGKSYPALIRFFQRQPGDQAARHHPGRARHGDQAARGAGR
jgi:hypothetical protein